VLSRVLLALDKPTTDAPDARMNAFDKTLAASDNRSPTALPVRRIGPQTLADAAQ